MKSLTKKIREPFPYYLQDDRKNLALITAISLFVVIFMYLFKTPGDHDLTFAQHFIFGGITFVCLVINVIALPKMFPSWFDNWTLGKYIVINLLHLLLIGVASSMVDIFYFRPHFTVLENVVHANSRVIIKGIIPIALTTLFLRNSMLRQNLKSALQANQALNKISLLKTDPSKGTSRVILHSETSETLEVNLPDLLFVEADDNYSTVVWTSGNSLQKKLLRANLKSIERQLDNSFTLRCHRSFLVNINAIYSVTGNANGYKLKIRDSDITIPVSRQKGKVIMEKIHHLRSMMELA